ncbi:hypothetical protein B9Z55_011081 [Caenorhabditis nigoni]|uniref:Ubiquitin-like protease family profile domain-containing protein n=1 Tax=Caenorhabditis nigoni TaxID=1611254 RepID=A0A2G5UJ54_9PELO|nr:hypothetical protein B9Z55_011081 [Caenorhabditis nigoni]
MPNQSDNNSDEDNHFLARKRHWLAEEVKSPNKRQKKVKGFAGFLFNPLNNIFGMWGSQAKDEKSVEKKEEDVVIEKTTHVLQDTSTSIIYLNRDSPEPATPERAEAGGEDDVVVEKHVHHVEVSDDSDSNDVAEVPTTSSSTTILEKSFEKQQEEGEEEEPDIVFENVVKTPNRQLQEARRFQNELIYLNETQQDDEVSVSTATEASPTPDDSVSRSITPLSLSTYSSNNVRDFWRRSSSRKPQSVAKTTFRQPFKYTSSIQRVSSGIQKTNKTKRVNLSSRDRLLQGVVDSGQYEAEAILGLAWPERKKNKNKKMSPTSDVLARAQNKISELRGASRSTTPLSTDSSVIFEGASSFRSQPRTPSVSSISSATPTQQKFRDLISQIDSLGINSAHRGPQRYEHAYEKSKQKEDVLLETARIRQEHRAETKGDRLEETRKNLELIGIVLRPKVEKKKVEDFVALPDAADRLIEKAWNRSLNGEEQFVDAFNIPICRKDLETLSGLHWLNDNIINFYLQLICDRSTNDSKYPKTYAFNTFFYTNVQTKGYASVKRWTRKVDIFSHDILLIPVHLGMHWCMAVVDIPEKKIEFYDSLYDGNTQVLPALKSYLASESMDKKKQAFDFSGWTIRQMEDIPRQQNGSDCGVFSCQFGEWASRRTLPRFTQKNMPYYRKRMAYEIVSQKLLSSI